MSFNAKLGAALLGLALVIAATAAFAQTSRIYTRNADFDGANAVKFNVDHAPATTVNDGLELTVIRTTFPVLWIANAAEDTVSKIDTVTGTEIARYRTWFGPGSPNFSDHPNNFLAGPAPSRTAVDVDGNAYVLNRHFDGRRPQLMKILNTGGIDRNGNDAIDTSTSAATIRPLVDDNPTNAQIDTAEIQDERIAWVSYIPVPNGLGRALCIGIDGHLWVGLFNTGQYYKVSSVDGSILAGPISVPWQPYGCLVDSDGTLWSATIGGLLGKITNTHTAGPYVVSTINHSDSCRQNYGIALGNGKVYLACVAGGSGYIECNPETNSCFRPITAPNVLATGISVDGAGDIWLSQYQGGGVFKHRFSDHAQLCSNTAGAGFEHRGVIIDQNNDAWQIGTTSDVIKRFRGTDCAAQNSITVGDGPYTYSDASGFSVLNQTRKTGTWTVTQDAGVSKAHWGHIKWTAGVPAGSLVEVKAQASDNLADLAGPPSIPVTNGATFTAFGRYIKVETRLTANTAGQSPQLLDISISISTLSCDVDRDGDVDRNDLNLIAAARNQPATGADDPRDADGDGRITVVDLRICSLRCTRPDCATVTLAANDDAYSTTQGATLTIAAPGVLANDTPAPGKTLTAQLLTPMPPAQGTVTLLATGGFTYVPAAGFTGNATFAYRASDGVALSNIAIVTIAVAQPNRAPTITSIAPTTAAVGLLYRYQVTASDPDAGDALTFSLPTAPAGMTMSATGVIQWTPTAAQIGSHDVVVRVQDQHALGVEQRFRVEVQGPRPQGPRITSVPVTQATECTRYNYPVQATDSDATQNLTFSLSTAPAGMFVIPNTGEIFWLPTRALSGLQDVTVRVRNNAGLFDTQSFVVNTAARDQKYYDLACDWSDQSNPNGVWTYKVFPHVPVTVHWDDWDPPSTQFPSIFALPQSGWAARQYPEPDHVPVWMRVVSPTVYPGNVDVPILSVQTHGTQEVTWTSPVYGTVEISGSAWMSFKRDREMVWRLYANGTTLTAGPLAFNDSYTSVAPFDFRTGSGGPSVLTRQVVPGDVITLEVGKVADPAVGEFVGVNLRVTVQNEVPNAAPLIDSVPVTSAGVGQLYSYQVRARDPNAGDVLAYSIPMAPSGMTIHSETGLISWTPTSQQTGQHSVAVRVTDRGGLFAEQSFQVTVSAPTNQPPLITSTPVTAATVGQPHTYQVTAADPNVGDVLTFSLPTAPAGMAIIPTTGMITWTPAAGQVGSHDVIVKVTDTGGLFAQQSFRIEVRAPPPGPPVIASVPATAANQCGRYVYKVLASDPNPGEVLTYSLDSAPAGMQIVPNLGAIYWLPSRNQLGTFPVTVRVRNQAGQFAVQPYSVVVSVAAVARYFDLACDWSDAQNPNGPWWYNDGPNSPITTHRDDYDPQRLISGAPLPAWAAAPRPLPGHVPYWLRANTPNTGPGPVDAPLWAVYTHGTEPGSALVTTPAGVTWVSPIHGVIEISGSVWMQQKRGRSMQWTLYARDTAISGGVLTSTDAFTSDSPFRFETGSGGAGVLTRNVAIGEVINLELVRTTDLAESVGVDLRINVVSEEVNAAPVITSKPVTTAVAGQAYAYQVTATDPNAGDKLTFSLTTAPTGMSIDPATGLVAWVPTPAQVGAHPVVVRAADVAGLSATQPFSINVGEAPAPTPLQLSAALVPEIANAGQTVTLTVAVSGGNGGTITRSATLNGTALVLNASGVATFAAPAAGVHIVNVTATGSPVNGSTPAPQSRQLLLSVRNSSDTTAPIAIITSPVADSEITAPVAVRGTASDANIAYYQLLLRPAGSTAWVEFHRGLASVTNNVLGTLDPAGVNNGMYELGLNVVDVNGLATSTVLPIEISRDRKLGQFRLSFTDIHAHAAGLPLMLTRTYDSLKKDVHGDFGWGWSASASDISVRQNMVLGSNWQLETIPIRFLQCLRPIGNRRVTITLPDGGVYRFQARNDPECRSFVPPDVNIVYDPLPLPVGGSTAAAAGAGTLAVTNVPSLVDFRGSMLFDWDLLQAWSPTDFIFTGPDGVKYTLRQDVGVLSMTDRYGNTVSYGPGGYQHNASLGIQLTRDGQGRITQATDPAGRSLNYAYNAAGELASVTDRVGQVTQFQYETVTRPPGAGDSGSVNSAHLLSGIVDPRGVRVMRQQFDEFGRLAGNADANGASATQTFDEANNQQRVADRRGNATTYTFDAAGNVTRIVDAKGGITELTYDANGNELTRRDPLGNTVTTTYNATSGKVLTETDPLGRVTTTTYPATGREFDRQNPIAITDPLGRVTTIDYRAGDTLPGATPTSFTEPLGRVTGIGTDGKGNLVSLNVAGIATTYAYDSKGRRTSETDGLGNATTYTFDDNGNELTRSVKRTVGGVTRTETITRLYDSDNRLTQETDATGAVRRTTYDSGGREATTVDALGRITRYAYDANGRRVRTEFPDGTNEQTVYDANGNETSKTDRQGRVTVMVYDELNRLVQTRHPDGSTESNEYDAAGRLTAEVSPVGARIVNGYDAAGQLISQTDASGRRTEHGYDAAGNRTQTKLPDGRLIRYTYDDLNRLTRTDYPDGSALVTTYRPDGRKATETDPRGVVSTFGYDAAGRLTSVVQSGVPTATTYGYDETRARTRQADSLAHAVQWKYDAAGRPISRTLPDGATETFSYDGEGRLAVAVTFGGQTITRTYDSLGRELTRTIPATASAPGRTITWTYNAQGLRATQTETGTNSSQGTTTYTYDALNRLMRMDSPQGSLSWTYDAAGRVTQRTTAEGTTGYEYDSDGRLTRLTAPDDRVTTYNYDAAGRLTRSEQQLDVAAGVSLVTERRYDAQDRAIAIAHSRKIGAGAPTLISGQAISRGTGGAVSRIDTFDNSASFDATTAVFGGNPIRAQTFAYDANARLVQENNFKGAQLASWLTNSANPATTATTYAYDGAGNRTGKTLVTPVGTETTAYAYDANDRLTGEVLTTATGSTVATTYAWDDNGNLLSRAAPSEFTSYAFDAENRLVEIRRGPTQATAATVMRYGYDADGQRIRKTTDGATTKYLIDPSFEWAQVVLESSGSERVAYVRGDSLRQQTRGGQGTLFGGSSEDLIPVAGHLQTTLAAVDRTGAPVEFYESSAFGEGLVSGPRLNHQFAGEYFDSDARLIQLRARWLDPTIGRMVSLDPSQGAPHQPATLNRYSYANNDPLHVTDPSGGFGFIDLGLAGAIQNSSGAGRAYTGRLVLRRVGCELTGIVAAEAVDAVIYVFLDGFTGLPYVGQTVQGVDRRVAQHVIEGKREVAKVLAKLTVSVKGFPLADAIRLAEQYVIDMMGGVPRLANQVQAIGSKGRLRAAYSKLCK